MAVPLERGSRVLVTGASSGIGAELAVQLAERQVAVGLVARRAERLAEVAERCRRAGAAGVEVWRADLGDLELATKVGLDAWDRFGGLDAVVLNAGIPLRRHATRITSTDIDRALLVNYRSPAAMALALLPRLLDADRGSLAFVSSLAGRVGVPREAAYAASKFALCGFAEALAIDLDGSNVDVRLVLPGAIDTEIWDQPANEPPIYNGPLEPAGDVAKGIIDAIEGDAFEWYVPDLKPIVEIKTSSIEEFLAGAAAMARGEDVAVTARAAAANADTEA